MKNAGMKDFSQNKTENKTEGEKMPGKTEIAKDFRKPAEERAAEAGLLLYILPAALGVAFLLWYIRSAAADVVYSDHIRLTAEYLPEVGDFCRLLVPDVLTRIPAAFAERFINVRLFGYSVTFERLLGAAGMGLMAVVTALYAWEKRIRPMPYLLMLMVLFSLGKWEILLNGTAWSHLISFGLFFINYLLLDHALEKEGECRAKSRVNILLKLLPFVILLFAGEYIASYAVTMLLMYGVVSICKKADKDTECKEGKEGKEDKEGKESKESNDNVGLRDAGCGSRGIIKSMRDITCRRRLPGAAGVAAALLLYLLSRHFAVWEHAGAADITLTELLKTDPGFFVRFLLRSFGSAAIGGEVFEELTAKGAAAAGAIYCIGLAVVLFYMLGIYRFIKQGMYRKTLFPLALMVSGLINHLLVLAGRWIFLKESYAMSSRYGAQFMVGILGVLLVLGMPEERKPGEEMPETERKGKAADIRRNRRLLSAGLLLGLAIAAGNGYTTYREIRKAPYREENYERMAECLLNHEDYTSEELAKVLEWHKDPAVLKKAVEILEGNRLNVFREKG